MKRFYNKYPLVIVPIKLILYYFLYQFGCTLFARYIIIALNKIFSIPTGKLDIYATVIGLVLSGIAMIIHLIYFKYIRLNLKEVSLKTVILSLPFIFSALIVSNIINELFEFPNIFEGMFYNISHNPLGLLSMVIIAPIVEEMLFRGAIEGFFLKNGVKPIKAIGISALIFGLIHVNPAQVLFACFLGLVFGWLYYRTGSIIPGMAGHVLNNSIATILMTTGTEEDMSKTTQDMIGTTPTYVLLVISILILIAFFIYLWKTLPKSPFNSAKVNPTN
ncbi:MAG: lysostaphin resistance A-like protein [Phocaeicola sp.]|uniref:CPBP family intramembrane glutamic endopeptidase n=1 Tax=Phocaeicola TaxID=909656 RepID=UPI00234EBEEC|nr:type II CAAX endopeptidase family protein [Phocaeicola oris]MCE2617450.1 CPBP family intramembrane metalloprotease [Phocaeicola oris]